MRRARTTRSTMGRRMVQRTTNQYWVDLISGAPATIVPGTPQLGSVSLKAQLGTDYDATLKGATIMAIRGDVNAVPDTAVAAATTGELLMGILVDDPSIGATNLNPVSTGGRQRHWMHLEWWPMGYSTPGPTSVPPYVTESRRPVNVGVKRIFRENSDDLILAFGATGTIQTWLVQYHLRCLVRVP